MNKTTKAYQQIIKIIQNVDFNPDKTIQREQDFNGDIRPKIHFTSQNIDLIVTSIIKVTPNLKEVTRKQIIKDLEWVFDPQYSKGKSELNLLEAFRAALISGQREPVSKKGRDMTWKNELYSVLDIEKIIQVLRLQIEQ